jgi:hypothetical protein
MLPMPDLKISFRFCRLTRFMDLKIPPVPNLSSPIFVGQASRLSPTENVRLEAVLSQSEAGVTPADPLGVVAAPPASSGWSWRSAGRATASTRWSPVLFGALPKRLGLLPLFSGINTKAAERLTSRVGWFSRGQATNVATLAKKVGAAARPASIVSTTAHGIRFPGLF